MILVLLVGDKISFCLIPSWCICSVTQLQLHLFSGGERGKSSATFQGSVWVQFIYKFDYIVFVTKLLYCVHYKTVQLDSVPTPLHLRKLVGDRLFFSSWVVGSQRSDEIDVNPMDIPVVWEPLYYCILQYYILWRCIQRKCQ